MSNIRHINLVRDRPKRTNKEITLKKLEELNLLLIAEVDDLKRRLSTQERVLNRLLKKMHRGGG
jgi:hypothetical protein